MNQIRKRCLIICPTDTWGGVEKNVLIRARELSDRGHKVTVVLKNNTFEKKFTAYPHIHLIRMLSRPSDLRPAIYRSYRRIIRETRPDCIFIPLKRDWWAASRCAKQLKVPRIVLYLGIKRDLKQNLKYRQIFKRYKAHLLVNSKDLRDHLVSKNRYLTPQNTHLIYNGFPPQPEDYIGARLKDSLPLPDNAFVIGCAGRFSRQKGFDHLATILPQLPEHAQVLLAGEGAEEENLKASLEEAGVAHRVHFVGNLADMAPFYRSLDCFLLPSRNEGMANVLNEAMSYGLPVVSTRVPGSAELLEDGHYGVLTDIDDTDAMARALNQIMQGEIQFDPAEQRQKIANEHDYETMIDLTEQLFFGKLTPHSKTSRP